MAYITLTKKSATDISGLKSILLSGDIDKISSMEVLLLLESYPFLIKECKLESILVDLLLHKYPIFRWQAALLLDLIGSPLGIKHLTYNAVRIHPIIGENQGAGYHDLPMMVNQLLLPLADKLPEDCIDLLLQDMVNEQGNRQFEILSAVKNDSFLNKITPLLDAEGKLSVFAAYILAQNGRSEGRGILEKIATLSDVEKVLGVQADKLNSEINIWISLSLMGLSCFDDHDVLDIFLKYLDDNHLIAQCSGYLKKMVSERIYFIQDKAPERVVNHIKHFYYKKLQLNGNESAQIKAISPGTPVDRYFMSAIFNFLATFANKNDRKALAELQRSSIENLDFQKINPDFFVGLPNLKSSDKISVTINLQQEDYLKASTEWLMYPEKYRRGIYHSGYAEKVKRKVSLFHRFMLALGRNEKSIK